MFLCIAVIFLVLQVLFCLGVFCGFSIWFFWDVVFIFWALIIAHWKVTWYWQWQLGYGNKHFYRFCMAAGFATSLSLCMSLWVSHIWISSLLFFLFSVRLAVRLMAYCFEFVICYFCWELFEFFECMFFFFRDVAFFFFFFVVVAWEIWSVFDFKLTMNSLAMLHSWWPMPGIKIKKMRSSNALCSNLG